MAGVQVPIEFIAKFEEAAKGLDGFSKSVDSKLGSISKGFAAFGVAAVAAAAVFVGKKLVDGIGAVVDAASEAEASMSELTNAMRVSGDFSERNARSFEQFAEKIQATTKFDDDLIISQIAVAKRFGATNQEATQLVQAATELATVTGIDLNQATELLGRSLDGTAGRLNELVPGIRSLTAEQLTNLGAAKLINETYGGSSAEAAKTFTGALANLQNGFSNLLEKIGEFIIKNRLIIESVRLLGSTFNYLADAITPASKVDKLKESIAGLQTQIAKQTELNKKLDEQAKNISGSFKGFALKQADEGRARLDDLRKSLNLVQKQLDDNGKSFDDQKTKIGRFNAEIDNQSKSLLKSLKSSGTDAVSTIENRYLESISVLKKALSQNSINSKDFVEAEFKLRTKKENELFDLRQKAREEEQRAIEDDFNRLQTRLKDIQSNPIKLLFEGSNNLSGLTTATREGLAAGAGILQNVLQGKEGARKLVGSIAEGLGQAFLGIPGLGSIVELLSQGPDQVRTMVTEFANALPEIIENIADSIPVVVEVLAEKLTDPDFIGRLAVAFAKAATYGMYKVFTDPKVFERFGQSIANAFTFGSNNFITKILEGAGQFVERMVQGAGRFVEELIKKISDIGGALPGLGGGGGGLTGIIGGITGSIPGFGGGGFGFAEGGVVPDGFPNDTFPAKLTSGEVILNKQQQAALQQPQEITINLQIGQSQLAKVILDLNRLGYRTA